MAARAGGYLNCTPHGLTKSRVCDRGRRGGRRSRLVHGWVSHTERAREEADCFISTLVYEKTLLVFIFYLRVRPSFLFDLKVRHFRSMFRCVFAESRLFYIINKSYRVVRVMSHSCVITTPFLASTGNLTAWRLRRIPDMLDRDTRAFTHCRGLCCGTRP